MEVPETKTGDILIMHEVIAPLGTLVREDDIVLQGIRINDIFFARTETYIQIHVPRCIDRRHAGAGSISRPWTILRVVGTHRDLVEGLGVMLIRLIAVEHIRIYIIRHKRLAGTLDDLLHHRLRRRFVLREDIEGLHIDLREQTHRRPIGGAVVARGIYVCSIVRKERAGFPQVVDHELPALSHRITTAFDRLGVADNLIDDRHTLAVGVHLKEDLAVPVRQRAVEEALTFHIIQLLRLRRGRHRTESLDTFQGLRGEVCPFADIRIGRCQIPRLGRRVVVLTERTLVIRTVQIRRVVVQPNTHREPIKGIEPKSMILGVCGGHKLIHLLQRGREISLRQGLRVVDLKEVLARRHRPCKDQYICYLFHNIFVFLLSTFFFRLSTFDFRLRTSHPVRTRRAGSAGSGTGYLRSIAVANRYIALSPGRYPSNGRW